MEDQIKEQIMIVYHYPCLDGSYSASVLILALKAMIKQLGFSIKQIKDLMIERLFKEQKINQSQEEIFQGYLKQASQSEFNNIDLDLKDDNNKGYFYTENMNGLFLIKGQHTKEQTSLLKKLEQQSKNYSKTLVILLDYSINEDSINKLCSKFEGVIILDHHITFWKVIEQMKNFSFQNFYYEYNIHKSGCTLVYDFVKKILFFETLAPKNILNILNQQLPLIEDYDIKGFKEPNSESFVQNIYKRNLILDLRSNQLLIYQFLQIDLNFAIEEGKKEIQKIHEQVEICVQKKKLAFLGGKSNPFAIGYSLKSISSQLTNFLASRLAELSLEDGFDNIGILYYENKTPQLKVSLRACNKKEANCNEIAEKFNGGGHKGAASFFIEKKRFFKWL